MSKIIVDEALQMKLRGLQTGVELCDAGGKTVGFVVTTEDYRKLLNLRALGQHSDAKIAELRQQIGGRKLSDIWSDLEAQ